MLLPVLLRVLLISVFLVPLVPFVFLVLLVLLVLLPVLALVVLVLLPGRKSDRILDFCFERSPSLWVFVLRGPIGGGMGGTGCGPPFPFCFIKNRGEQWYFPLRKGGVLPVARHLCSVFFFSGRATGHQGFFFAKSSRWFLSNTPKGQL